MNYSLDDKSASDMNAQLGDLATEYLLLKADVSSVSEVNEMMQTVIQQWGSVDVLVNNAGIIKDKLLMFLKEEDWDRVLDVNLRGTYICSKAVIKSMIGHKYGKIVNMTSPSAITGRAGQTNYSASKGGVISFTKSLAKEVARLGITVNAVCPGVIANSMTQNLDDKTKKELCKMIPMEKFGDPDDVAHAVLFLASDKARYITGHVLAVDGGLT